MQVRSLPRHVIRNAMAGSRLNAADAAQAVGVPRVTLYRWAMHPEPGPRRLFAEPDWATNPHDVQLRNGESASKGLHAAAMPWLHGVDLSRSLFRDQVEGLRCSFDLVNSFPAP